MGFGAFLFGYLFFCDFTLRTSSGLQLDVFPDLVAWLFLAIGCLKLGKWSRSLKIGAVICLVMLPLSALQLASGLRWITLPAVQAFSENAYSVIEPVVRMIFHYFLLCGVIRIASLCEGQEDLIRALKARVIWVSVCFALLIAVRIALLVIGAQVLFYAALAASILTMCYLIPVELVLYSAWRRITIA